MRKIIITTCGAIIIGLLLMSSATAVPTVNSDPLMNIIDDIEKTKMMIEENIAGKTLDLKTGESINLLIKSIKDTIYDINPDSQTSGIIINLLILIIKLIISIVQNLINLVYQIINLVEIIKTLVNLIGTLFNLIIELINLIIDIFTPGTLTST